MNNQLNISERNELERCEVVIKQGLKTFVEVGQALMLIREKKLYRAEYGTFEAYCREKWQIQHRHARRLIDASNVFENIQSGPIGPLLPQTETQARPLTKLEPEIQREAWQETVNRHGEKVTQKKVQEVVKEFVPVNEELKQAKKEPMFAMTEQEILAKAKEIKRRKNTERQNKIEAKKQEILKGLNNDVASNRPMVYKQDCNEYLNTLEDNSIDLLITDPPYSTDVDDIELFAKSWVGLALSKVKENGRAFICIGAYPKELNTYLNILLNQDKFIVDNPLIWTYRNTLGVTPKMKYNLNYQIILHLYSQNSNELDTTITNEMFTVQDINAPDGRQGNRYHTWQKPNELADRLIRHTTQKGDKVIDCFCCTGTFLLAAAKLERIAEGCDISEENLLIAKKRGCDYEI